MKKFLNWNLVVWLLVAPMAVFAAKGGIPGKPIMAEAEAEAAGNNLSFPVIWSDGYAKALRGTFGEPAFNGEYFTDEFGVNWYLQQDMLNSWQAESTVPLAALYVDEIDWGDNLEAKDWTTNSVVRVETVLYQNADPLMEAFTMQQLWGQGVDEMWGTNTATYLSPQATVYSNCARLTIQKLTVPRETPPVVSWNSGAGQWEGDVEAPDFIGGVWEAGDGPGYYSAEINIPGKVIYGYNWRVKKLHPSDTAGDYRLTFSLSQDCGMLNTYFDADTLVQVSEEEGVTTEAEDGDEGGDTGGGIGMVDYGNNLTYIDVRIVNATGSGGGGGGGGGGPGGSGGGGGGGGPRH
jgi:uncharacterized membrane protein YgcG